MQSLGSPSLVTRPFFTKLFTPHNKLDITLERSDILTTTTEIVRLYYEEKLSMRQISTKINCSYGMVKYRLKLLGKDTRTLEECIILRNTPEYFEKLSLAQTGEKGLNAKLTKSSVLSIRQEYEEVLLSGAQKTATQYYLVEKHSVKRSSISDIVLRKTWKYI
jgi:hypothetical protein